MSESIIQITLKLSTRRDTVNEELNGLSQSLRTELLDLDVKSVEPVQKKSPSGSKTGPAIDWTTLIVTLVGAGGIFTTLVTTIQAWLTRHQESTVTLKLSDDELTIAGTGPYSAEQEQAIQTWLSRNKGYFLANE